jgi:AraC-like DNA-binding protein
MAELEKNYYFNRAEMRKGSESTQHYHSDYEIYYLLFGKCKYFIDKSTFDIEAGDLVIIPSGVIHKTNYPDEPHSRILINFSEDYVKCELTDALRGAGYIYRNDAVRRRIEDIFAKIECEYSLSDSFSETALECYTAELLLLILRNPSEVKSVSRPDSFVDSALRFVGENYMNDVSLASAAELLSVSSEHLSREFKRVTGFGFCEYLTLLRLRRAEFMLKNEPGLSVSSVAYSCGFNDSNYFSHKFKLTYGKSPKELKNAAKSTR